MIRLRLTGSRRITIFGLILFSCTLLGLVWLLQWSEATRKIDQLIHDGWVRYNQRAVPDDVVIAAIDAPSLAQFGRWPWQRDIQAQLFEQLTAYGARAVVVDLLYVEPSSNAGDDARLVSSVAQLPMGIFPVLTEGGRGAVARESLPIPSITRNVTDLGHIFLPIDDDGIVRRIFLKSGFNQSHWPTLSLAALNQVEGPLETLPGRYRSQSGSTGKWVENHEVLIPFYGPNGVFRRISAFDIIEGNVPRAQLAGKIVFVGVTTTGLNDVVPTPVSALDQPVPGVEIHATVFSALRDQSLVTYVQAYTNLLVAFVLLPVLLLLYSRAPPMWSLFSVLVGAALPILVSYLLYSYSRVWYAPLSASVPLLLSYLLWSWHRLEYLNRFLEREGGKLEYHQPMQVAQSTSKLLEFFTSAERHLPIKGWRFSSGGKVYSGGTGLPELRVFGNEGAWRTRQGVHSRLYPGREPLNIEITFSDSAYSEQVTGYVNTLARVRSRRTATNLNGSIEKLQTNALKLSEQMAWLRNIRNFSDTILDGSPAGFAVWNAAGECIRANRLLYQMVPAFKERASLADFVQCFGVDFSLEEDETHLRELILESRPWQITHSSNDKEMIINFSGVGETLSERMVCATVLDVSDIRTAERARAEMVDYLSHDLRSPLISALALLEQDEDPRIEENIQHSLTMMDDLLHVARADSLSRNKFAPVLLNAVLDNALDQMLPQALHRKIQFEVETVDEDLWIEGDAASLERAVTNILSNAIKYSPEGTEVRVSLGGKRQMAVLIIDDQGVGIDPAMLDELFTRFKRDAKSADKFKGIGLGLALVARVVSSHNGTVVAQNTREGTRIIMQLPLEQGAEKSESDLFSAPVVMANNQHVG